MKALLVLAAVMMALTSGGGLLRMPAHAGETTKRHSFDSVEDLVIRDKLGRKAGKVERNSYNDDYTIRDNIGRRTGTIEKTPTGDYAIRDQIGRRIGTLEED